jgi:hypothetical protein
MGEIKFIAGFVMIILFSIAIVSYVVNFANDNEVAIDLSDDPEFSGLASQLEGNVTQFNVDANSSSKSFYDSEITEGDETTRTGGQFKVGLATVFTTMSLIFNLIFAKIFGNDIGFGVLFTAITGLLIFVGIRLIWKTWKGGNPD